MYFYYYGNKQAYSFLKNLFFKIFKERLKQREEKQNKRSLRQLHRIKFILKVEVRSLAFSDIKLKEYKYPLHLQYQYS